MNDNMLLIEIERRNVLDGGIKAFERCNDDAGLADPFDPVGRWAAQCAIHRSLNHGSLTIDACLLSLHASAGGVTTI
jgi:hypothetical protein